jgi:hypothetical protein
MKPKLMFGALPLVLGAALLSPSVVEAKFILITHGDTINHVGEVTSSLKPVAQQATANSGVKVGYKYSYFGIFWLDLWTWGGEYCLYSGKQGWALTPTEAAMFMGVSEDQLSKPFLYKFPLGLIILAGVVLICIVVQILKKSPEERIKQLFEDRRYQKALTIISEQVKKDEAAAKAQENQEGAGEGKAGEKPSSDGGFEAAVVYLTEEGIPRAEAEQNLAVLLNVLAQVHAQEGEQS